jgi:flavin reductase (DIM6/NTAB) family NADH-FMN oxidoreductase RutF
MPANSCVPVSDSPAIIALAVRRVLRTNKIISKSRLFSLNWISHSNSILRKKLLDLAAPLKESSSPDKLATLEIKYTLSRSVPIIEGANAQVICRVEKRLGTGDHVLFIGRVISAKASKDFRRERYWSFKSYRPILYLGSNRSNPLTTL